MRIIVLYLSLISLNIHFSTAHAYRCEYLPTVDAKVSELQGKIAAKSGKGVPKLSCGGGDDWKVCYSCKDRLSKSEWAKVKKMLSLPAYRNWHSSWHAWEGDESQRTGMESPKLGEAFLFMHREMIRSVQANLASKGLPCLKIRKSLPHINDRNYKVNKSGNSPHCDHMFPKSSIKKAFLRFLQVYSPIREQQLTKYENDLNAIRNNTSLTESQLAEKEDAINKKIHAETMRNARVKEAARILKRKAGARSLNQLESFREHCGDFDPVRSYYQAMREFNNHTKKSFLKKSSMGELGAQINMTWHGSLHGIYSTVTPNKCRQTDRSADPDCDGMEDPWSAHVNQNFHGAVHGPIDSFIERWLKVKNFKTASTNCAGKDKCYQWKSTHLAAVPDFVKGTGCKDVNKKVSDYPQNQGSAPITAPHQHHQDPERGGQQ